MKTQSMTKKLNKFELTKILAEEKSLKERQRDEEKEREWLQMLRQIEIDKLRKNHEFIKEQDKRIYAFWEATEKVKMNRIAHLEGVTQFMTEKMKADYRAKQNQDTAEMLQNEKLFLQTCIRQGVEIEKDPQKKPMPEKAKFSAIATLMKIRDRTQKNEEARRARQKRKNKLLVDQIRQQEEIEKQKALENKLEQFNQRNTLANKESQAKQIEIRRQELERREREIICQKREQLRNQQFEEMQIIANQREQILKIERREQMRIQQLEFMQCDLDRKIHKREKHQIVMQPLISSILDLVDKCYLYQQEHKTVQIDNRVWKSLAAEWHQQFSVPKIEKFIQGGTSEFFQYYCGEDDWKPSNGEVITINEDLGQFLFNQIDLLHPMQKIKTGIDFKLPLKISLIGGRYSGRKATAKHLQSKYGLEIIDIEALMKEAQKLAFPPPEDPKKKKDPKAVIEVIQENPELKALGIEAANGISEDLRLKFILLKLKQAFGVRTIAKIKEEMMLEEQKFLESKKVVVEEVKPIKKGSKAPPPPVDNQELLMKEYLNSKSFYYTKGWIMIGFPESVNQAMMLEEALTGYVPLSSRLNPEAELRKQKVGQLVQPPQEELTESLRYIGCDLVIALNTTIEQRIQRMNNRRVDVNGVQYNLEDNPPPPEIKPDKLLKIEGETEDKLREEITGLHLAELSEWAQECGIQDFPLYHEVNPQGKSFDVAKSLDNLIDQVINLNKAQYIEIQTSEEVMEIETQQVEDNQEFDTKQCLIILDQWDEASSNYSSEASLYLSKMITQIKKCCSQFQQQQQQFLNQFETPDRKVEMILEYQTNYNKFLHENEDLSKQKNAQQILQGHLQTLSEQIWDVLAQKKNEALHFIKNKERFVIHNIQQFLQHVFMLLQVEINLLHDVAHLGKQWEEHFILEPPQAKLIDGDKFPQLEILILYYFQSVESLQSENIIIKSQVEIALQRGVVIREYAILKIKEMLQMEKLLQKRIDEWIISGIKEQNDYANKCIAYFKNCINQRQLANLQIQEPGPISNSLKIIVFDNNLLSSQLFRSTFNN